MDPRIDAAIGCCVRAGATGQAHTALVLQAGAETGPKVITDHRVTGLAASHESAANRLC
jgi:hypothetical protein